MTKEEFVAQLNRAALTMPGLPVTTALVKYLAGALNKGDPPWWGRVLKAWEKRKFVAWAEAAGIFLACVHYEALSDAKNPLVPYFPSCGGTDEADPSDAFAEFLADPPKSFFDNLKIRQRRVYFDYFAPLWLNPAALFFQKRDLPFYLVEVNAGAGLYLAADVVVPPKGFVIKDIIAARIGIDPVPLDVADLNHRRWLTAAIMPDQMGRIAALDKAIETVRECQHQDATFIQRVECKSDLAVKFVAKNIPADDKEVGLLLFNIGVTGRMTDPEYEDYMSSIAEMMRPWEDRALWVEIESVRGEIYSTTFQLRAHRIKNGKLFRRVLASYDFVSKKAHFKAEENAQFLA